VLKTPLSAAGHTHPVYAMQMVGTQNAHNLITSSTDGMVCSWLVDMLAQPQVCIFLNDEALTLTKVRKHWNLYMQVTTRLAKLQSQPSIFLIMRQQLSGSVPKKEIFTKQTVTIEPERKLVSINLMFTRATLAQLWDSISTPSMGR
jgi:transcription-repair coupling factor (superfamily II helicase)